jgi:hypothetical protein
MKKVIFIGGTSYSGSTMLDMILANDEKGFSCGEVHALFRPYRSKHINPVCGCGSSECEIWKEAYLKGEKNFYETIFSLKPDVDFIVDSSKNPVWIQQQTKRLVKKNIAVKNVLIWKTPLELSYSYKKRGRLFDLKDGWVSYHRRYMSMIANWKAVKYIDVVNNPNILKSVCEYLGVDYFKNKQEYWNKTHHTLFGNTSAKYHLSEKEGSEYNYALKEFSSHLSDPSLPHQNYRRLYNVEVNDQELNKIVENNISNNIQYNIILDILSESLQGKELAAKLDKVKYSFFILFVQKFRRKVIETRNRVKYLNR